MAPKKLLILSLLGILAVPSLSHADKWYHSPWFWGSAGVVGGGVVGYALGRESARPYYAPAAYPAYVPAYAPVAYSAPPAVAPSGDTYYREKWAFPFYHKIESFPVRSTMPVIFQPAAVSMASSANLEPVRNVISNSDRVADSGAVARDLTINIGDNNQNVHINFDKGSYQTADGPDPAIDQVYNNPATVGSRVVDVSRGVRVEPNVPKDAIPPPVTDRNRAYRELGSSSDRLTSDTATQ
ncbi:hypothetical protein IT570_10215 [Candidatus Sumerlaeota bacterium]|nr:hypothetical protein [Candidatus Sumerlaeota bacterium]